MIDSELSTMMTDEGVFYVDYAKLHYGRMLWRHSATRERLLRHWTSSEHPHADRFQKWRVEVERILASPAGSDRELDLELRQRGLSLRVVVKEIPSVFGSFF
ncbi:MAG: hypothetical protein HZA46_00660 [Planctomycetales bacterium]|nr:hypothetical protein [Planctomycetales bacterium]